MIKKIKSLSIFRNKDLFDIRSFVIVFTIYSLISIWLAHASARKDEKINFLLDNVKLLKSEYIHSRTVLMNQTKQSNLLEKGELFGFYPPSKPITIINLEHED